MGNGYIESGRDDAAFVQPAGQIYDDLAWSVVVYDFKFANVTVFHHYGEEFDDNFGARPDQHLPFASLFGVVDRFESIAQYVHSYHG